MRTIAKTIDTEEAMKTLNRYCNIYHELSESFELLSAVLEENVKLVDELKAANAKIEEMKNDHDSLTSDNNWLLSNLEMLTEAVTNVNAISIKMRDEVEEKSKPSIMTSFVTALNLD